MSDATTIKAEQFERMVGRLLRDDASVLSEEEINNYILLALNFHNKIKPKNLVIDITGDGEYDYSLPDTYIDEFSTILSVEFPAGDRYPVYLEPSDWIIYRTTSVVKLRFLNRTPSATETIRLNITTPYTKDNIIDIPANDQEPFCYLAAALAAKSLSLYYAQSSDDTIEVSTVDYGELSDKYAVRARELKSVYDKFFGVKDGVVAAMGFLDWDTNFQWGEKQFTHGDESN